MTWLRDNNTHYNGDKMDKEPDFKTWDEVKAYIDTDDYESVWYSSWSFNRGWMGCSECCCDNSFSSVDEVIDCLQSYSKGNLDEVTK